MNESINSPNGSPQLQLNDVGKSFGEHIALQSISLQIHSGEIVALLGPSGCGKTTLLRCIAGLMRPDWGSISIAGQLVGGSKVNLPPESRKLGMVFQDYGLWPHMSLRKNVEFPLEMRHVNRSERRRQVDWALGLVGLLSQADRPPGTLSGGQQQRIALARAIVGEPRLLLMDEPLSNLDRSLRDQLAFEIRELISSLGLTAVFVTHDQQEAYALADRVAVLQEGVLQQLDPPRTLFESPATPEIARFLDIGTLLEGEVDQNGFRPSGSDCRLPLRRADGLSGSLTLLVPRRSLTLTAPGSSPAPGTVPVRVRSCLFQGERNLLKVAIDDNVDLESTTEQTPRAGEHRLIRLDPHLARGWTTEGESVRLEQVASTDEPLTA